MKMKMKQIKGFSLMELLVTIAIIAIISAMAAPSFRGSIARSKLSSAANTFASAVSYARSEAIKLGGNSTVVICASEESANLASSTCPTNPNHDHWSTNGWKIVRNGSDLIQVGEATEDVNYVFFGNVEEIEFDSQGLLDSSIVFKVCHDDGVVDPLSKVINISGQIRDASTTEGNTVTCP